MKTEIIYIIIAILLLVILVNLNVKEGFSTNFATTYNRIDLNATKQNILDKLTIYKDNYLTDINSIFDASLNKDPNNIYGDNEIHNYTFNNRDDVPTTIDINKFDGYTQSYRIRNRKMESLDDFQYVPGLNMTIHYNKLINTTDSYIAIKNIVDYTQSIITNIGSVFANYNNNKVLTNESYTQTDINDYKMILLLNKRASSILIDYDSLNIIFMNNSFITTNDINLLSYHESIIQILRRIISKTPLLLFVCYPYFNGDIIDNISELDINNETTYTPPYEMFRPTINIASSTYTPRLKELYRNLFIYPSVTNDPPPSIISKYNP